MEPKFIITTKMEQNDYKRFVYLTAFRKNKATVLVLLLVSLLSSGMIASILEFTHFTAFFVTEVCMFALLTGVICLKIELRCKRRIATDKTGFFNNETHLSFFEDKVVIETPEMHSKGEFTYQQFYKLYELKDYFAFYLNANQASLLRKRDITEYESFQQFIATKFTGRYIKI